MHSPNLKNNNKTIAERTPNNTLFVVKFYRLCYRLMELNTLRGITVFNVSLIRNKNDFNFKK